MENQNSGFYRENMIYVYYEGEDDERWLLLSPFHKVVNKAHHDFVDLKESLYLLKTFKVISFTY